MLLSLSGLLTATHFTQNLAFGGFNCRQFIKPRTKRPVSHPERRPEVPGPHFGTTLAPFMQIRTDSQNQSIFIREVTVWSILQHRREKSFSMLSWFQTTGRPGEECSSTAAVKQSRGKWELQFPSALTDQTVLCESGKCWKCRRGSRVTESVKVRVLQRVLNVTCWSVLVRQWERRWRTDRKQHPDSARLELKHSYDTLCCTYCNVHSSVAVE